MRAGMAPGALTRHEAVQDSAVHYPVVEGWADDRWVGHGSAIPFAAVPRPAARRRADRSTVQP